MFTASSVELFQAGTNLHRALAASPLTGEPDSPIRELVLRTPYLRDLPHDTKTTPFPHLVEEIANAIHPAFAISSQMLLQTRAVIADPLIGNEVNIFAMGYSDPARRAMARSKKYKTVAQAHDTLWKATDEIGCHLSLGPMRTAVELMKRLEFLENGNFIVESKESIGDPDSQLARHAAAFLLLYIQKALELTVSPSE